MAGLLISGPAGGGKSAAVRQESADRPGPTVIADFQAIYAALLLLDRGPDGRYPERQAAQEHLLPLAEYTRRAVITGAVNREIFVIATNSDGNQQRRQELLGFLGPGSRERVIDPGIEIVTERLSVDGTLSEPCRDALNRWYGRL